MKKDSAKYRTENINFLIYCKLKVGKLHDKYQRYIEVWSQYLDRPATLKKIKWVEFRALVEGEKCLCK